MSKPKVFGGRRELSEIKMNCLKKGWHIDTSKYEREGSDFINFQFRYRNTEANVVYSTFNGRFFGHTSKGEPFSSDMNLDHLAWFSALLNFVYISKAEAAKQLRARKKAQKIVKKFEKSMLIRLTPTATSASIVG